MLDREVKVDQEVMFTDPGTGMTFVGVVIYMPEFEKPDTVLVKLEDNIILACARSTVQPFPYAFDQKGLRYPMQPNSLLLAFKDTNDRRRVHEEGGASSQCSFQVLDLL